MLKNNDINKQERWIKKNYPSFYLEIDNKIQLNIKWKEKLYLVDNNLTKVPLCNTCKGTVLFLSYKEGYRRYCCTKCLSNNKEIKEKRKATCIDKYGTENPMKNKEIKEKLKDIIFDKYGTNNVSTLDSIKKKKEETQLLKYGHKYNSQRTEIKAILSQKMKDSQPKILEVQQVKLNDYWKFKLEKIGLKFIKVNGSSRYDIECSTCNKVFNISKSNLNDRIKNNNIICTICNPVTRCKKEIFNNEDFLKHAISLHKDRYTYLSEYVKSTDHIKMQCNRCSRIFDQQPSAHLQGNGCSACSRNISNKEIKWLDSFNNENLIRQHKINISGKIYNVDAYDPITNTVYEFYGDYWHGNPEVFDKESMNKNLNITFGELYNKTINREKIIKNSGFYIISIWESEYIN
jgi:hypothetical protein